MILPILNMDVTPFVQFLVFVAYIGLIFGLSVELIGRNPLNMLRVRDKEEGSAINAEGSVITSEDSAITSEGSAIRNENSVKESENSEGNTCLADWGEIFFSVIEWHWDTVFFEVATHIQCIRRPNILFASF